MSTSFFTSAAPLDVPPPPPYSPTSPSAPHSGWFLLTPRQTDIPSSKS